MRYKTILGFDFGFKRIGVAVGQAITGSASPLTILAANRGVPDWRNVQKLIEEWGAEALIVGLPLNMDGTEQPVTKQAREFGAGLQKHCHMPVFFVDERLTTVAAREAMHAQFKGAARFDRADSMSAKLIVESWLDSNSDNE